VTETIVPGRVLVVDDEALMGSVLRRMLAPHDVVAVQHPRDALARLRTDPDFDVLLVDLMLPGMTGPDLLAELAALGADFGGRVVFVTGGAYSPEARAGVAATSAPVLEKPFDRARLKALVDERVRARRARP
jgi:CheY-like chemotaxis protein